MCRCGMPAARIAGSIWIISTHNAPSVLAIFVQREDDTAMDVSRGGLLSFAAFSSGLQKTFQHKSAGFLRWRKRFRMRRFKNSYWLSALLLIVLCGCATYDR